jgi:hypothetical protein
MFADFGVALSLGSHSSEHLTEPDTASKRPCTWRLSRRWPKPAGSSEDQYALTFGWRVRRT